MRQQILDLQAHNQELEAFAHTLAHNLKGSMGTLVSITEALKGAYGEMSAEEQRELLDDAAHVARKMSGVVDGLLLVAQMNGTDVTMEPLNMETIVEQVLERLADMIAQHHAEIIVELPSAWPVALGYAPWVEEVWVNYVSNAIKYGGQPPWLELGAEMQTDGTVRFWVSDNGPGIEAEDQARLFQPFTRLTPSRASGYGLGLSIVRRIVERLGGQAGVSSIPGHGSIFSFTLPGLIVLPCHE